MGTLDSADQQKLTSISFERILDCHLEGFRKAMTERERGGENPCYENVLMICFTIYFF